DVLFDGVEHLQRLLLTGEQNAELTDASLEQFARSIERVTPSRKQPTSPLEFYELDPSVLSVLTEYEEHRLRTNAEQGVPIYRLTVNLSLSTIDSSLEELKARAKPLAEIITYLPSVGSAAGEVVGLDVILASRVPVHELEEAFSGPDAVLHEVR